MGTVTLGVSIAVPEPHGGLVQRCRLGFGDAAAAGIPTHVTLLPPTDFEAEYLELVGKHLAEAAATVAPFTMRLAGTGTFRPVSQVVFVQVSSGIAQCEMLEEAVRRPPIEREVDFPYHPHVTVGHDVPDEQLDAALRRVIRP